MTISFPTDKTQPFVAENGVTYFWDTDRWRVKTYKVEEDSRLPYRIETDKVVRAGSTRMGPEIDLVDAQDNYSNVRFRGVNGIDVTSDLQSIIIDGHQLIGSGDIDLTSFATIEYSDAEDNKLQLQIDELGVTKGKVARYTTDNVSGSPVARPGELAFNSSDPATVNLVSFGTEDADGILTKPMADQDIIEFVDAANSKVSRYKIIDASGAPTLVAVEYVSGDNDFQVGEEEQVYIYPQNASGVSKDYVDDALETKVNKTGDTIKGLLTLNNGSQYNDALVIKAYDDTAPGQRKTTFTVGADGKTVIHNLIKSTRETGFAFEVKPGDSRTNASWSSSGRIDISLEHTGNAAIRTQGSINVKKKGQSIDGDNIFMAGQDRVTYTGPQDQDNCVATKKYVDDNAGGGSGVELWGGDSPPPVSDRGTLLLTKSNALYIYTAT